MRKPFFEVSGFQVPHKPGCAATEVAEDLKFRIWVVEGLYYPYNVKKGPDQLRSYCAANLQKADFLVTRFIY